MEPLKHITKVYQHLFIYQFHHGIDYQHYY